MKGEVYLKELLKKRSGPWSLLCIAVLLLFIRSINNRFLPEMQDEKWQRMRVENVRVLHHRVQNGSAAHLTSYPMSTRGSFRGVKVARA
jgi:hypothetical protein